MWQARRKSKLSISMAKNVCTHKEVTWNPNSSVTLASHRPQHDRPAACVIAQQYPSANCTSLYFHYRQEKLGACFKNVIISVFELSKNNACLKEHDLKFREVGMFYIKSVWVEHTSTLECYAPSLGTYLPTFRRIVVSSSSSSKVSGGPRRPRKIFDTSEIVQRHKATSKRTWFFRTTTVKTCNLSLWKTETCSTVQSPVAVLSKSHCSR